MVAFWPVPRFVIVTVAPGTAAPLESKTVPLMAPLLVCAIPATAHNKTTAITRKRRMRLSPSVFRGMRSTLAFAFRLTLLRILIEGEQEILFRNESNLSGRGHYTASLTECKIIR